MAFVRLAFFPGATVEQYEALRVALSEAEAPAPSSRLVFAAGPHHGGLQVLQVWESQQALDAFNHQWLFPAVARLGPDGFPTAPTVVDFETHDLHIRPE